MSIPFTMDTLIIIVIGIVSGALLMLPFIRKKRNMERLTHDASVQALRYGLHEPASLHPIVDPEKCIGTGGCISACPEDVLGIRNGQGIAVSPARCVGHGLCERSCPVDAISLVFGTEKRGVEIPRIQGNFETNVPGMYIIGELGGMGLIANAFEQARQCITGISRESGNPLNNAYDVLIVGAGPAGFAASMWCKEYGLHYVTLEKEPALGGTVRQYPRKKLVMTRPLLLPGYGKITQQEIQKEDLISLWDRAFADSDLDVRFGQTVDRIHPVPEGGFLVESSSEQIRTRRVVLAIGRRGIPRKLGCSGEDQSNVYYSLREPDHFKESAITVVGGGDSAIEAAIALSEQEGNQVRLSYRRNQLSRIKPDNLSRFQSSVEQGAIVPIWESVPKEIMESKIVLETTGGEILTLQNDETFVFIGGTLPTPFLQKCGIEMDVKFGKP